MLVISTEVGLSTIQMPQEGGVSGEWEYFTVREGYGYKMLDLNRQDNAKELLILVSYEQYHSHEFHVEFEIGGRGYPCVV